MQTMTAEERFQFDLEGYLVVPGVLSASEVVELNELADEVWPGEHDDNGLRRTSGVLPMFRNGDRGFATSSIIRESFLT